MSRKGGFCHREEKAPEPRDANREAGAMGEARKGCSLMNTHTSPAGSFSLKTTRLEKSMHHGHFSLSVSTVQEKAQMPVAEAYVSYPCMGQARVTGRLLHRGPGAWCSEHSCEEQNQNLS